MQQAPGDVAVQVRLHVQASMKGEGLVGHGGCAGANLNCGGRAGSVCGVH